MKLVLDGIGRRYGKNIVLDNICLNWEGPGVFLVTGPAGAGKSALLKIMAGAGSYDRGIIHWEEEPGVGYVPQYFGFYPHMTVIDFFDYLLLLQGYGDRRQRARMIQALVARADMDKQARTRLGGLAPSYRQRIAVVQSLIGDNPCLIWDCPEQNLRSTGNQWLLTLLGQEGENHMVIVASEQMELYSSLVRRVAVLHDGALLFEGAMDDLVATASGQVWEGKIPFRQWQKFRLENPVMEADIIDGGIKTRVLGRVEREGFEPVVPTPADAVEVLIRRHVQSSTKNKN